MAQFKILHSTGDVNPLKHGGGVVVWNNDRHEWWSWGKPPEGVEVEDNTYRVHIAVVERDMLGWYDWVNDLPAIEEYCGMKAGTLKTLAKSGFLAHKVHFLECVGGYHGMVNLDQYPLNLTATELTEMFDV